MTWTYSGDPGTSTRNEVRFLISDTNTNEQLFSDEELNFIISSHGSNGMNAAREAAEILIARFAREADSSSKSVGDISVSESYASKIAHYKDLANNIAARQMRKAPPRPFANAESLKSTADREVINHNTDFFAGMMENPNSHNDFDTRLD